MFLGRRPGFIGAKLQRPLLAVVRAHATRRGLSVSALVRVALIRELAADERRPTRIFGVARD